jgi:hypothetical protein
MYAVSIRYPRKSGAEFDFNHWAQVHMPLGIATFERVNGITPVKVMVQHETFGMDGTPATADSYITVWLVFDTRDGLDGFRRLHNDTVKSAALDRDFGNYTPQPPSIMLGEVTVFEDMAAVLARGRPLLESAKTQ